MSQSASKSHSVTPDKPLPMNDGQFQARTIWIMGFLVFALIILKSFIYIKDKKRHGK